ncbi:MAG: HAD hydrolase family protein [Gammaproteobacteria bacterium]
MGKPYSTELSELPRTFAWAMGSDITELRQAVRTSGLYPLLAIGSGGSLTAAHALAALHRKRTSRLAAVATPLEAVAEPLEDGVATWLISAGGRNADILGAFRTLVGREARQLCVLCGREGSNLMELARGHAHVDAIAFEPPSGKDGFLATNSLLAFVTLLSRAYKEEYGEYDTDGKSLHAVESALSPGSELVSGWRSEIERLWCRETILVLYGADSRIGAIDLESKFTEAALVNLQIADYRNFAHGRHHWLAKRGTSSAVLALVAPGDRDPLERTLRLIPRNVPTARIFLEGCNEAVSITSLLAALHITGWAGKARGIDPGRPGVPEFGRRLYNLPFLKRRPQMAIPRVPDEDAVAIERKAGLSLARLDQRGALAQWRTALTSFRKRLTHARFVGVVLDYDGTIVDPRDRFFPPKRPVIDELSRLVEDGVYVAIATGRGASVRRDLQKTLPRSLWPRLLVGYYNGAEVAGLDDDSVPNGANGAGVALAPLALALRSQSELAEIAKQTDRPHQITIEARQPVPENRLWDVAHQVILMTRISGVTVTRSSHSIDIVTSDVSKLNVVRYMRRSMPNGVILAIGDRGRWPGNDYELLREPFALSVDELSVDPETCWNLAPRGQRGVSATLAYLRALESAPGGLRYRGIGSS